MRVLVTDGTSKATLGIVRSLGRKGIHVSVLAEVPGALAACSRYCERKYVVATSSCDSFMRTVMHILRQTPHDLIIPQGQRTTAFLAQHKADLVPLTKVELSDSQSICKAADKRSVYEQAVALGIPVPKTTYPLSLEDVSNCAGKLDYPVVVKQLRETGGIDLFPRYAESAKDLISACHSFVEQKGGSDGNLLLQDYVPGWGCGFFALYQHGVCKRIFMHRRIRENPPTGKVSSCAESFYDPKLKHYGIRLLDSLTWHGIAMVEFRFDTRDGEYKLLEINPRFWGSLDLALAAGVDFPYYLCQMARGETLDYSERYITDLRYHWPLSEEIQHLVRRPASLGAVLRDFFSPSVKSNIWLQDLGPSFHEGMDLIRSLARKVLRG